MTATERRVGVDARMFGGWGGRADPYCPSIHPHTHIARILSRCDVLAVGGRLWDGGRFLLADAFWGDCWARVQSRGMDVPLSSKRRGGIGRLGRRRGGRLAGRLGGTTGGHWAGESRAQWWSQGLGCALRPPFSSRGTGVPFNLWFPRLRPPSAPPPPLPPWRWTRPTGAPNHPRPRNTLVGTRLQVVPAF